MADNKQQPQPENNENAKVHKNVEGDKSASPESEDKTPQNSKESSQDNNIGQIQEQLNSLAEKMDSMETIIENTNNGFQETLNQMQASISNITLQSGASISEKDIDKNATTPDGEPFVPLEEMNFALDEK